MINEILPLKSGKLRCNTFRILSCGKLNQNILNYFNNLPAERAGFEPAYRFWR